MTSPLPTLFGRHHTKQLDLDQPDGCDHDQNVYHYRLVDGQMIFRAVRLGHGWESRPMSWTKLSCYKKREDEQMAQITQESGRPEPRADKDEIMARAKVLIDGGMKVAQAARELGVPGGTLSGWISKEKRQAEKARRLLESVDGGKKLQDKVTEVVVCRDCEQEITGTVFQSSRGPRCFECAVNNTPSAKIHAESHNHHITIAAPIGVEVPQYELDDEPVDDIPGPVMVEKEFDRKAFVIEMIESVMELSQLRNAPAEITLELIDAVLVVA